MKPVYAMLVEKLYERGMAVPDLHVQLREAGHRITLEYLCRSILGAGDLKEDVIRHIIVKLELELEREERRELCAAYVMRGE